MLEFRINTEIGKRKQNHFQCILNVTNIKCEKVMDSKGIYTPKEWPQHIKWKYRVDMLNVNNISWSFPKIHTKREKKKNHNRNTYFNKKDFKKTVLI